MSSRSVVTIGSFDGVHVGHAALVARARDMAAPMGAAVVAMAFDPHPAAVLRPEAAPARLTTFAQRERLLLEAGADYVERLEPAAALLGQSPGGFLEWVGRRWAPIAYVEGTDFRFGRERSGDVDFMIQYGARAGFAVCVVEPVLVMLGDNTVAPASSTLGRWLITNGRVGDAARVLGRPHELEATVVPGERRGRTLGFPTANLASECLLPADGVYGAEAHLPDGRVCRAAVSVGSKPTFGGQGRVAEAYLLDVASDGPAIKGLPEYGWGLRLSFTAWVREQVRFDSVGALIEQMHLDCSRVRVLGARSGAGAGVAT